MAIKATPSTTSPASTGSGKITPESRFVASLNNKYKETIAAKKALIDQEYKSVADLKKFNKSLEQLTEFLGRFSRGVDLPGGGSFKANVTPTMKGQLSKLKTFSETVKQVMDIQKNIQSSISKLDTGTKGSRGYSRAYTDLQRAFQEASQLAKQDAPEYVKNITTSLRNAVEQAAKSLATNAIWKPAFTMVGGGRQTSGPFNYTSSRFSPLKQPGAAVGQGWLPSTTDMHSHFGHIGLPIETTATNTDVAPLGTGFTHGPRSWMDKYWTHARRMGGGRGGRGGGGGGGMGLLSGAVEGDEVGLMSILGAGAVGALGMVAAGAMLAGVVGKIGWDSSQSLSASMKPTLSPYNEIYRAAMMTGTSRDMLQSFLTNGKGGLGAGRTLSRWGYTSAMDAAETYGAYGGSYRRNAMFEAATRLSQGANTAFMGSEQWNKTLGGLTGKGFTLGTGSLEQTKQILIDSFAAGAKKGMPSPEMWDSLQKVVDTFTSSGGIASPANLQRLANMATYGAGSAVTTMRSGEAASGYLSGFSDVSKHLFSGTGIYNTAFLTEALRTTGTTNLGGAKMQEMLRKEGSTYTLNAKQRKVLDELQKAFPGALGDKLGMEYLSNEGLDGFFMGTVFSRGIGSMGGFSPDVAKILSSTMSPEEAKAWGFNSGSLGTPPAPSTMATVLSAHGAKGTFFGLKPPSPRYGINPLDTTSLRKGMPAELATGPTGATREVDASATAAKLAFANFELDALGHTVTNVNTSFTNLFRMIDKWVTGSKIVHPGPSS